ncbi:PfkB family carbohydrate kinase [Paenibacillus algorifonticola]|nr:PfkB family carbohydrate kinase [Paenibacillus algorifonticola]
MSAVRYKARQLRFCLLFVIRVQNLILCLFMLALPFPKLYYNQGETLIGNAFSSFTGGKGANQAVACARLGAVVTMIGCVGEDAMAQQLRDALGAEGIDMHYVKTVPHKATGIAAINVTEDDNRIIFIPGENHCLLPENVLVLKHVIAASDMAMQQHEIPLETVEASIKLAHSLGIPVILNPAPASIIPSSCACLLTIGI